jgi:hypothetical protein
MGPFSWAAQEEGLSPDVLTRRVQEIDPDDVDETLQDIFFPRKNVNSVKLKEIGDVDFRPVSDRREWNTRGRQINMETPDLAEMEFIPVEDYFKFAEKEIQDYGERVQGNVAAFRDIIRSSIPDRIDALAEANFRRLEIDYVTAWTTGTIIVRHPHKNATQTVSYNYDPARWQNAATPWDDAGVDAYAEFIAWAEDGKDAIGSIGGVVLRRSLYRVIQADAPMGLNGVPLTAGQFEDQVSQDLGVDFRFYIRENQFDVYADGGGATTATDVWPDEKMALLPSNIEVGNMCYAPIYRAHDMNNVGASAGASFDNRGQRVFVEVGGNGRELTYECQVNAFPVPREKRMWVIDAGA